jgi:hypothetical protein
MTYVLVAYIVVFGVATAGLVVADRTLVPPDERDPPLESLLDLIMAAVLLAGMIFVAASVESPPLKIVWKPLAVATTAYAVVSNLRGRKQALRDPQLVGDRSSVLSTDIGTLVLLVPAVLMNLYYAFII